jgi:hypothetical protein
MSGRKAGTGVTCPNIQTLYSLLNSFPRHRRQPDQNRYNKTHKSLSQGWRRKRRGAFFWKTASWWRSARISAGRAARVRKLVVTKAKKTTKRELIVVATTISRMVGTPVFSDRMEFLVTTDRELQSGSRALRSANINYRREPTNSFSKSSSKLPIGGPSGGAAGGVRSTLCGSFWNRSI